MGGRSFAMSDRKKKVAVEHRGSIGYALAKAHNLFRARMTKAIASEPIHLGHVVLLASLYAKNDPTQAELAQTSGIEKSSVVLFLDFLEQDGWIERRRHPTDRRAHHIHLTDAGRKRFIRIGKKMDDAQTKALAKFSPAEQAKVEQLLTKLIASLDS
jgi:DNA-binding MarR family transcriptional regulator